MATMYPPPPGPPPVLHASVQCAPSTKSPPRKYSPPPGPPPSLYPQNGHDLSKFIRNNLTTLATQGWLSVPLPPDLESLYADLFAESANFFNLPSDSPVKLRHAAPSGKSAADEGFADIPGEKQLITLRRLSGIPDASSTPEGSARTLQNAVTAAWDATGELFLDTVHTIAESLGLDEDVFDEMSADAHGLPATSRATSLLRLFRYNRPPQDTPASKTIVAEAHKDLGILTLVVGHSPGLDARDSTTREWISVEDTPLGRGRLTATLLGGRTLSYLTRGLYASGDHRVSVRPPSSADDLHRFSLVFALRPAGSAPIHTDIFARSPLVGPFPPATLSPKTYPQCSMHGEPARVLFDAIVQNHWSVNVKPEIREMQKKRLAEGGPGQSEAAPLEAPDKPLETVVAK